VSGTSGSVNATRSRRLLGFERVALAGFWAMFAALSYLFPYNGDDWAWGSHLGIHRLHTWFHDYNGRYAGDLVVLVLVRTPWLTPLVMSAVVTLSLFLVLEVAGRRTPLDYSVAAVLFLAMPRPQWREAVAWLSGFSNYAFGTLCLLVFLWATKLDWTGRLTRWAVPRRIGILVLGFVSALFVENITIYLVVASLVALVAIAVERRTLSWDALGWFVGCVAGAVVMFSNGEYRRAQRVGYGHRVEHAGIGHKLSRLLGPISRMTFGANIVLGIVLVLLIALMALGVARRGRPVLAGAMLVLAGLVLAVAWTMQQLAGGIALGGWRCLNGLAGLVLLGLLCVGAALTIDDRGGRLAVYGCSLSIVVLVVPLAFVNPVGPRCFYCTYFVLLVLAGLVFTGPLAAEVPRLRPALTAVATAAAVALFAGYFAVYGVVTHAADRRIERVRAEVAAGATTVHLRPLPFGDYVHEPDPKPGVDTGGFKAFYHLPRTLRIVLVRA
jgi:hypothetical protein